MNNRFELGQIGQISHQLSNLSVVQEELRYGMSEKEKRNRAIFEEAGIRRMFQSYIDSKKVTMGNRSTCIELMGKLGICQLKTDYEPAIIAWGLNGESISLLSNRREVETFDSRYNCPIIISEFDYCTFILSPRGDIGIDLEGHFDYNKDSFVKMQKEEIPQYISQHLHNTV